MKHGGAAGMDLSGLLNVPEGNLGSITGALGGMMGQSSAGGGAVSKLAGPVTEFVKNKGFPEGVAQKVVSVVLPKLLELVQKH